MPLIYDDQQRVADWVCAQSGEAAPSVDSAIGFEVDGQLVAGVYFDCYAGGNIFAHIAADRTYAPWTLLQAVATYAFEQLRLYRLSFLVPMGNAQATKLVERMGSSREAVLPAGPSVKDWLVLYGLYRDNDFVKRVLNSRNRHGK